MMSALISQFRTIPVLQNLQTGKTIVITGANSGLGLEAARHFTRLQADRIILACRDVAKGNAAVTVIHDSYPDSYTRLDVWQLDLGVFDNVKTFAARAENELDRLDVLLSNASIAPSAYSETGEGWESTLAVNVIGTSLLAVLLLPKLRETAKQHKTQAHLTITSSAAGNLVWRPLFLVITKPLLTCLGLLQGAQGGNNLQGTQLESQPHGPLQCIQAFADHRD
jgi:NAD(P)-dependent dehydrogenase (short-subunit alcohol dehydrogenase family)